LPEGYILSIQGTTSNFDGLLELINPSVLAYFGPSNPPTPTIVTATDLQDGSAIAEGPESSLVQMSNVYFQGIAPGQKFTGATNYLVFDGIATATVRVPTGALG